MKQNATMKETIIRDILNTMSRDDLRDCAKQLNVSCGKDKTNTVNNLVTAFTSGTARFKVDFTIKSNPPAGQKHGCTHLHRAKLRSYDAPATLMHRPVVAAQQLATA